MIKSLIIFWVKDEEKQSSRWVRQVMMEASLEEGWTIIFLKILSKSTLHTWGNGSVEEILAV